MIDYYIFGMYNFLLTIASIDKGRHMPRTVLQNKKIKENRQEAILKSSLELFSKKGFDSVSTDDITEAVGCSHGLFYHYYKDKNEVFNELLKRARTKDKLLINKDLDGYHGIAAIKMVASVWCDLMKSDGNEIFYFHMFLISYLQKTLKNQEMKNNKLYLYLIEKVKEGQKDKDIAGGDPRDYVDCFMSMFEGLSYSLLYKDYSKRRVPDLSVIMNLFDRKVTFNV
jgi:AcrR family transcriptional regulator